MIHLAISRSFLVAMIGFTFLAFPAHSQTAAEIKQATKLTGREQTKASSLVFLSALAESKGQWKKAKDHYSKLLEIYKNDPGVGTNAARYAYVLAKSAYCDKRLGDMAEANKKCKDALAIVDASNFDENLKEHNYAVMTRQSCAMVVGKLQPVAKDKKALPQLKTIANSDIKDLEEREKQVKSFIAADKKDGPEQMKRKLYLANVYTLEKKFSLAEPLFKEVIKDIEDKSGKHSPLLLTPLSNYGFLLKQQGKQAEADEVLKRMQMMIGLRKVEPAKVIVLKHNGSAKHSSGTASVKVPTQAKSNASVSPISKVKQPIAAPITKPRDSSKPSSGSKP